MSVWLEEQSSLIWEGSCQHHMWTHILSRYWPESSSHLSETQPVPGTALASPLTERPEATQGRRRGAQEAACSEEPEKGQPGHRRAYASEAGPGWALCCGSRGQG